MVRACFRSLCSSHRQGSGGSRLARHRDGTFFHVSCSVFIPSAPLATMCRRVKASPASAAAKIAASPGVHPRLFVPALSGLILKRDEIPQS